VRKIKEDDPFLSLLLLGPPGIGKSTVVFETAKRLAKELEKEFIDYDDSLAKEILRDPKRYFLYVDFNLNDTEPSDLTGIPKEDELGISYRPFLWAICLAKASGILFLDEITNIQRLDVISASYKIVLDHRAGFTRFSKEVMVIAAGNSPEEASVANLLPVPLIDRFIGYKVELPSLEGWANWMDNHFKDWDKRTLAYLRHFPNEFLKLPPETETLDNFPSPRSWTKIALLLLALPQRYWKETIVGSLGPETGEKYSAYLETKVPSIEELLRKPQIFKELGLEGKYLSSVFLGSWLQKTIEELLERKSKEDKKLDSALPLLEVMMKDQKDFMVLSVISAGQQKSEVALALSRKQKEIKEVLAKIATLRMEFET
jgi:DNA polymerase III delta prime subunit